MRKNTREVFIAWLNHRTHKSNGSIWTDGEKIFSYKTILVQKIDGEVYLNRTKYSPTTSNHQNGLAVLLTKINPIEIVDIPRGTNDLRFLQV